MSFIMIDDQETEAMEESKHKSNYLPPPPGWQKPKPHHDGPIKEIASSEEKSEIASPPSSPPQSLRLHKNKEEEITAFSIVEMPTDIIEEETKENSVHNTESSHGRIEAEKNLCLTKAWEDKEKSKADNKVQKKFSEIMVWENKKMAYVEAGLKNFEEKLEKKKARKMERVKNRLAKIRQKAEAKRVEADAEREKDLLKVKEEVAKYRATGTTPKEPRFGCFGQKFKFMSKSQ